MLYREAGGEWVSRIYLADPPVAGEPEVWLALMGRFTSSGHFSYEQVSPGIALHVVRSGHGVMRVGGAEYVVGAGDVFAFFPGTRYHYADRPSAPWRYTWCVLGGPGAAAALSVIGITGNAPLRSGDFATALEPLFLETEEVYVRSHTPPLYPVAAAWRLLDLLGRGEIADSPRAERRIAAAARTLIEERFMTDLTIGGIARRLDVDRSTLYRRFLEAYDVSPKQYLDTVRLRHARRLLRDSRTTVGEAARLCGFSDSHYFSRVYRAAYGHPPSRTTAAEDAAHVLSPVEPCEGRETPEDRSGSKGAAGARPPARVTGPAARSCG